MTRMQELNPKIQAIRQKYRGKLKDKQGRPNLEASRQQNEEVMAVYRAAGVNPAAGCLPILLQMPVFFAFYRLLSTSVELRNAPWILWIQDLAQPDPYYVLPLLMGASSVAMQRMMPTSPDPMQRRLMQLMPIMFTVFAFAFPAGLVVYWVTNNLLSMAQQALLMRTRKKRELVKQVEGKA
jgi:YidC/Oxa1 family membrane protein insertase